MTDEKELRDWIKRLHAIAEQMHKQDSRNGYIVRILRCVGLYPVKKPEDQCALRWSANIVAKELMEVTG